jgi:thymidylate kinase
MQSFLKTSHGINSIQIHEPDGFEDSLEFGIPTGRRRNRARKIIKNGTIERDPWTNVMLFTAARRLNWQQAMQAGCLTYASQRNIPTVDASNSRQAVHTKLAAMIEARFDLA